MTGAVEIWCRGANRVIVVCRALRPVCEGTPGRHLKDPARFEWNEVTQVAHYYLPVDAMTAPITVRKGEPPTYGAPGA